MNEPFKLLVFDEKMLSLILVRDEVLAPISGWLDSDQPFTHVKRVAETELFIPAERQPVWALIRTERFSFGNMHIYYGKIDSEEFSRATQNNPKLVVTMVDQIANWSSRIAHRLQYLVPMAVILDAKERKDWPRP